MIKYKVIDKISGESFGLYNTLNSAIKKLMRVTLYTHYKQLQALRGGYTIEKKHLAHNRYTIKEVIK